MSAEFVDATAAPGEILELFKGSYLSIAETIAALEVVFEKENAKLRSQLVRAKRIEDAAKHYFNHYLLDEADDSEWCINMEQFEAVRALQAALTDEEGKSK